MEHRTRTKGSGSAVVAGLGRSGSPIWVAAGNFYLLVLLASLVIFVTIWAFFHDGLDDSPLVVGGLAAVSFGISAIAVREFILNRARSRVRAARRLSLLMGEVRAAGNKPDGERKLSLEMNEEFLREIRRKSEAAKVLDKFADVHKDVFELCERYMSLAASELSRARPGSPRIPALKKGSGTAARRHRFHVLKWAEIKARGFSAEASNGSAVSDKVRAAKDALAAVEHAIRRYPLEPELVESRVVLDAFLTTSRLRAAIENAEDAVLKGDRGQARQYYAEALESLERSPMDASEKDAAAARIRGEIDRLNDPSRR